MKSTLIDLIASVFVLISGIYLMFLGIANYDILAKIAFFKRIIFTLSGFSALWIVVRVWWLKLK